MSSYTRLGSVIWTWPRWTALEDHGRMLYLALYTTAEAKRIVPGLFHGSITGMADAAAMPVDRTKYALDHLLEHELVEFDWDRRVTRLTELPDSGESPANGNVIRGWYKRFKDVPKCAVRDAHVTTLLWLMEEWAREHDKPSIGKAHIEAWNETFAHVAIPVSRRRGRQRLLDADTSTPTQPGLFDPPPSGASASDTVPETVVHDSRSDRSADSDRSNKIRDSETVREPSGLGSGSGSGSRSLSEEGDPGEPDRRPTLVLVPPVQPYDTTLVQLAEATNGRYQPVAREGLHDALCATQRTLTAAGVGPADLALVGRRIATAEVGIGAIGGDPRSRLSVWVAGPGNVLVELERARDHEREAANASAHLAELKKTLGY